MDFFITGFPRSKTGWFANYLSYGSSFCFHEGFDRGIIRAFYSDERVLERFKKGNEFDLVGNSDCGNAIKWRELNYKWPNARWVIISRDLEDVEASLRKITNLPGNAITHTNHIWGIALSELKAHLNPLIINFDFDHNEIDELHDYLGIPFSPERFRLLQEMRVDIHPSALTEINLNLNRIEQCQQRGSQ